MQDSGNREYQITEYLVIEREIGEHTGNIQINLQQVVSNIVIIILIMRQISNQPRWGAAEKIETNLKIAKK
jgi:hypothetical protein